MTSLDVRSVKPILRYGLDVLLGLLGVLGQGGACPAGVAARCAQSISTCYPRCGLSVDQKGAAMRQANEETLR